MKLLKLTLIAFLGLFISLAGCAEQEDYDDMNDGDSAVTEADEGQTVDYGFAIATINPTEGNNASGTVFFSEESDGIRAYAIFDNLPQGKHGFHVHLYGDCSAPDGTSAGTHYNFEGSSENPPADIKRITGNLGNANAGSNGKATIDTTITNTTIEDLWGRSVIVHAKGNDPSQPPIGAAGARLGCGVIGKANPETMSNLDTMQNDMMEEGN